ncbi:Crp/Fnr family transcriptional regulator [Tunicatimonas pelagia]|uniref:Crp/Fnr family transcriptional regulator n=1 Tax=Tunicatimonas pelagia TaxID=931531 RepID=UPI002665EB37|nr:Crp/Fnr family transcriptional regulator [Tunicatimonas pelagia]WKN45764.1 Crp/Fnr family transcriptional regulator [Tunicatimonas pelagia]
MNDLIRNVQQFEQFSSEELAAFSAIARSRQLAKGDFLLKEGQVSQEIAYVSRGLLMHYANNDGEPAPCDFAKEGEWVAHLKSFSSRQPSEMNIIALEDSLIYVFDRDGLQSLFRAHPRFMALQNYQVEQAFINTSQHANNLATLTAEQRYSQLIEQKPELVQRIPQYYLAAYLGIKPQSLSRIRKKSSLNRS